MTEREACACIRRHQRVVLTPVAPACIWRHQAFALAPVSGGSSGGVPGPTCAQHRRTSTDSEVYKGIQGLFREYSGIYVGYIGGTCI